MLGVSALFFGVAIQRASLKPFWHDEIYTIAVAELPSAQAIWRAERAGLDAMPPLNALLTQQAIRMGGEGRISVRLTPMIGFWMMTVVCFIIVRRRSNVATGVSAMVFPCLLASFGASYKARGYGLMVGFVAVALLAWSEAAAGRQRAWYLPILAITLAAAFWTHYYAALILVPILAGEVARLIRTRRPDWGVLASVSLAVVTALPLYPLAHTAEALSSTYFHRARLGDLHHAYTAILGDMVGPGRLVVLALGVALLAAAYVTRSGGRREAPAIPLHEWVAALATVLIPAWTVLAGVLFTGVFVPRYAMSAVVGLAIAVPLVVWRLGPRNGVAERLLCVGLLASFLYASRDVRPGQHLAFQSPMDVRPRLVSELAQSRPVVVTGVLYLQLAYCAAAASRSSLIYVADPPSALRITGTDSLDRDYLVLRHFYPVNVQGTPNS